MAKYILVHGIRVAKDFTPETFGRLTTLGPKFWIGKISYQVCVCECGTCTIRNYYDIRNAKTRSCGCLKQEITIKRNTKHGHASRLDESGTYCTWRGMIDRCHRKKADKYHAYGGRGIKVCQRWQTFENFLADMGQRPSSEHSLDRIDNDGDYCPENCRWATRVEQNNNTRANRFITAFGRTMTIAQWAAETGLSASCIRLRLFRRNWPIETALATPAKRTNFNPRYSRQGLTE